MNENKTGYDPNVVIEARRLRGLNLSFEQVAEELNKKGFKTRRGKDISVQTLASLFRDTKGMMFDKVETPIVSQENMISAVLNGPLQPEAQVAVIKKITSGEIKHLRYLTEEKLENGGLKLSTGLHSNPATRIEVEIGGPLAAKKADLIVHFYDSIRQLAESANKK